MNFLELAKKRFSVRKFQAKKVENESYYRFLRPVGLLRLPRISSRNASLSYGRTLGWPN